MQREHQARGRTRGNRLALHVLDPEVADPAFDPVRRLSLGRRAGDPPGQLGEQADPVEGADLALEALFAVEGFAQPGGSSGAPLAPIVRATRRVVTSGAAFGNPAAGRLGDPGCGSSSPRRPGMALRLAAGALALALTSSAAAQDGPVSLPLRAGAAVVKIATPEGAPLAGYGKRGPSNRHEGELAPVEARALVIAGAGGRPRVGLVALDVLIVSPALRQAIRERAAPLELDGLIVAATHTHSGPGGYVEARIAEVDQPGLVRRGGRASADGRRRHRARIRDARPHARGPGRRGRLEPLARREPPPPGRADGSERSRAAGRRRKRDGDRDALLAGRASDPARARQPEPRPRLSGSGARARRGAPRRRRPVRRRAARRSEATGRDSRQRARGSGRAAAPHARAGRASGSAGPRGGRARLALPGCAGRVLRDSLRAAAHRRARSLRRLGLRPPVPPRGEVHDPGRDGARGGAARRASACSPRPTSSASRWPPGSGAGCPGP